MESTGNRFRVFVAGGINCDITGTTATAIRRGTSNPGSVVLSAGGVARNIGENLARLGVGVTLFGAVGTDPLSRWVVEGTRATGVCLDGVIRRRHHSAGMYVSILAGGELEHAVSDMTAIEALRPRELLRRLDAAASRTPPHLLVLDTNLAAGTLQGALDWGAHRRVPVLVEPVSTEKAVRLGKCRGTLEYVTPNAAEAAVLRDQISRGSSLRVRYWIETDGGGAVTLRETAPGSASPPRAPHEPHEPHETVRRFPVAPVVPVNVNGAGDAFVAAFAAAVLRGFTVEQAVPYGIAAAAMAVTSELTVPQTLTWQAVHHAVTGRSHQQEEQQ